MYRGTSRRTSFVVPETLRMHDRRTQRERKKTDDESAKWLNKSLVQPRWHDGAYIVRSGPYTTNLDLENAPRGKYEEKSLGFFQV